MGTATKLRLVGSASTDRQAQAAINRFGFEYEMFPVGWRNRVPRSDGAALRRDAPRGWPSVYVSPDSSVLLSSDVWMMTARRTRRFRQARQAWSSPSSAPWEVYAAAENAAMDVYRAATRPDSGRQQPAPPMETPSVLVRRALDAGLIADAHQHGYHCHCETCAPERSGPTMCAQNDSSVAVEFVSRILDINDESNVAEVAAWIALMERWKADGGWMPDGRESNGDHVHVERGAVDYNAARATGNIRALYAVYDWTHVADGGCGQIRGYNSKPTIDSQGGWLSDRGYGTFEHRLWNTPRDPERLWAHIGISIGLTRWAVSLALHSATPMFDREGSWGAERMSRDTFNYLASHRDDVVEAVAAHIPQFAHRDYAVRVLDNLTVY